MDFWNTKNPVLVSSGESEMSEFRISANLVWRSVYLWQGSYLIVIITVWEDDIFSTVWGTTRRIWIDVSVALLLSKADSSSLKVVD